MNLKKILTAFSLFGIALLVHAQENHKYDKALESIFQAFKNKDYEELKPLIDSNVKIGALPTGFNDMVIPQVLDKLPSPVSFTIKEIVAEGENERVKTSYKFADTSIDRSFLFDTKGKIIDLDILGDLKPRATKVEEVKVNKPFKRVEIPFKVKDGIIYVKAQFNGKFETFILDSGAPDFILNSDNKKIQYLSEGKVVAGSGVGGKTTNGIAHIQSLDWYGFTITNTDVMTTELGNIGSEKNAIGLIGYNIFKDCQLTLDYKKKKIIIEPSNINEKEYLGNLLTKIPFEMKGHLPIFSVKIEGKNYKAALDTGASVNLANIAISQKMDKSSKRLEEEIIQGVGGEAKMMKGVIENTVIGNVSYPKIPFVFEDNTLDALSESTHSSIDILIGYSFLKKYRTTIDYVSNEIRIYSK
ncbi:aspartyl protease family protein [Chryseobacterium sp. MMS23-Vi53]|uniref:aspartyl protease family protein n=1 Tax=Chryseobacterium sp. MMS23-Vi53 TaxID=3386644 RepID=UPI0039EA22E0